MAFAADMQAKYELILASHAGAAEVTVDGQAVKMEELEKKWLFWKAQAAREDGTRPRYSTLDLRGPIVEEIA